MKPDHINALFQLLGSLFILINVFRINRDKMLAGVSVIPTIYYIVWGFWNLYYYPFLGQWYSFAAGLLVVAANVAWVSMAIYYSRWKDIPYKKEKQ